MGALMKYKVKDKNIIRLKKYINAYTETKSKRETERFHDEVRFSNKQGV